MPKWGKRPAKSDELVDSLQAATQVAARHQVDDVFVVQGARVERTT